MNLLLVCFGHHAIGHIPDTLFYDPSHGGHDALGLFPGQSLTLKPLHKMVRVKVVVRAVGCGLESAYPRSQGRREAGCRREWLGRSTPCE